MSKSKIIYVPQGCFAEITGETSKNIIGLMTSKINTCCHVIVHNKATGYLCLCHADAIMDVANKATGLPAWIKKACPAFHDYNTLCVYVGETDTQKRYEAARGLSYFEQVKNSLNKINQNILLITSYNPGLYGIFIERSDVLIERNRNPSPLNIKFLNADKDTAKAEVSRLYNDSIEIAELELDDKEFEKPFVDARAYSLEKIANALNQRPGGKTVSQQCGRIADIQDLPGHLGGSTSSDIIVSASDIKLRPISILDSLGTLQEAKAIMHENRFINPRRVLRNNEFDDESSGEKYQYYESGSDKDSSNSDSEAKENKYTESKIRANSLDNIAEPKVTYDDKYWKEKNPEKYLKEEYAEEKTITRSSEYLAEAKVIYDDKYWKDKHSEEKNKRWTIPGELKLRELDIQDRNNSDLGLNSNNITHSSSVGRIREVLSTEKSIKPTNPSVNLDLWNGNKKKRSKSGDGSPPWIPSGAANSLRSSSAGRIRQTLSREDSIKSVNSDTGKGLWEGGNKKRSKSTGKPPWMPPGSGR